MTVQCEQFIYFIILCFLPYMFRPLLGHHQKGYIYQHAKKMLYVASEGPRMLVFSLELRANANML
jgi:hypothetical protein